MKYNIMIANSRLETKLHKIAMDEEEVRKRLANPIRTAESQAEYLQMPRQKQADIKDVGGFVAGTSADGSRKADQMISRCMIVYDIDKCTPDKFLEIRKQKQYKRYLYTTHKHTPDHPRFRLLYEKEFQTKLARLNELNTILNQEGGKTDVHPEIQELQAKIDQTYAAMAADPQKYLEYLNFRGQCVGMGVENSVAVFAQNPKATYCPSPEAIGSPKVKPGEEDRSISVLRTDGIERVYALEQYDLPESEYLDKAPLQWTEAQHSDLIHRVEDAAQLADISVLSDLRHGTGFFDASRNVIHIREGNNSTEQLKSLLEGYSEAVITRTSTSDKPVAELESAALTALLQVRCGVPIDDQLAERITAALEDAGNVGGFSMRDSVARLHNAMEYCVRYAELEQTSEQYQAQQIEPEELTPQSEAFMEMM